MSLKDNFEGEREREKFGNFSIREQIIGKAKFFRKTGLLERGWDNMRGTSFEWDKPYYRNNIERVTRASDFLVYGNASA